MVETLGLQVRGLLAYLEGEDCSSAQDVDFRERTDQTLLMKFLELVIRIYEDPKITRTELNSSNGARVFDWYQSARCGHAQSVHGDIRQEPVQDCERKTQYVSLRQNWDTLADSFWLTQASQLLFGAVDMSSLFNSTRKTFG